MRSPLPLDYERPPEPEPGRWGCLVLSLVWTYVMVLVWAIAGVLCEAFGRLGIIILALACPFATLAKIGLGDGPAEKIAMAMLILLPWPACGLALTWAGWHGERRRIAITAGILAVVHAAAAVACVVMWK